MIDLPRNLLRCIRCKKALALQQIVLNWFLLFWLLLFTLELGGLRIGLVFIRFKLLSSHEEKGGRMWRRVNLLFVSYVI